jgi:hypothetical protein
MGGYYRPVPVQWAQSTGIIPAEPETKDGEIAGTGPKIRLTQPIPDSALS